MTAAHAIIYLCNPSAASAAWGIPFVNIASGLERVR
jgi:hypothetical protein